MQACDDSDAGSWSFSPAVATAGTTSGTSSWSSQAKDENFCKDLGHHQQLTFHTGSQSDPLSTCILYQPMSEPLELDQE